MYMLYIILDIRSLSTFRDVIIASFQRSLVRGFYQAADLCTIY